MARGQRARSRFERLNHHAYGQGASIATHGAVESRPRVECGRMDGASGVKRSPQMGTAICIRLRVNIRKFRLWCLGRPLFCKSC